MEYFWGREKVFSQWHPCSFHAHNEEFNCTEQYMMYRKAKLFKDDISAKLILEEKNPEIQKKLGRGVQGFVDDVWNQKCHSIVYDGNMAKFRQNEAARQKLFATKGKLLVEASPYDSIWGIGMTASDPRASNEEQWLGANWLGYILTTVREHLFEELNIPRSYTITWTWDTLRADTRIHITPQQKRRSRDSFDMRRLSNTTPSQGWHSLPYSAKHTAAPQKRHSDTLCPIPDLREQPHICKRLNNDGETNDDEASAIEPPKKRIKHQHTSHTQAAHSNYQKRSDKYGQGTKQSRHHSRDRYCRHRMGGTDRYRSRSDERQHHSRYERSSVDHIDSRGSYKSRRRSSSVSSSRRPEFFTDPEDSFTTSSTTEASRSSSSLSRSPTPKRKKKKKKTAKKKKKHEMKKKRKHKKQKKCCLSSEDDFDGHSSSDSSDNEEREKERRRKAKKQRKKKEAKRRKHASKKSNKHTRKRSKNSGLHQKMVQDQRKVLIKSDIEDSSDGSDRNVHVVLSRTKDQAMFHMHIDNSDTTDSGGHPSVARIAEENEQDMLASCHATSRSDVVAFSKGLDSAMGNAMTGTPADVPSSSSNEDSDENEARVIADENLRKKMAEKKKAEEKLAVINKDIKRQLRRKKFALTSIDMLNRKVTIDDDSSDIDDKVVKKKTRKTSKSLKRKPIQSVVCVVKPGERDGDDKTQSSKEQLIMSKETSDSSSKLRVKKQTLPDSGNKDNELSHKITAERSLHSSKFAVSLHQSLTKRPASNVSKTMKVDALEVSGDVVTSKAAGVGDSESSHESTTSSEEDMEINLHADVNDCDFMSEHESSHDDNSYMSSSTEESEDSQDQRHNWRFASETEKQEPPEKESAVKINEVKGIENVTQAEIMTESPDGARDPLLGKNVTEEQLKNLQPFLNKLNRQKRFQEQEKRYQKEKSPNSPQKICQILHVPAKMKQKTMEHLCRSSKPLPSSEPMDSKSLVSAVAAKPQGSRLYHQQQKLDVRPDNTREESLLAKQSRPYEQKHKISCTETRRVSPVRTKDVTSSRRHMLSEKASRKYESHVKSRQAAIRSETYKATEDDIDINTKLQLLAEERAALLRKAGQNVQEIKSGNSRSESKKRAQPAPCSPTPELTELNRESRYRKVVVSEASAKPWYRQARPVETGESISFVKYAKERHRDHIVTQEVECRSRPRSRSRSPGESRQKIITYKKQHGSKSPIYVQVSPERSRELRDAASDERHPARDTRRHRDGQVLVEQHCSSSPLDREEHAHSHYRKSCDTSGSPTRVIYAAERSRSHDKYHDISPSPEHEYVLESKRAAHSETIYESKDHVHKYKESVNKSPVKYHKLVHVESGRSSRKDGRTRQEYDAAMYEDLSPRDSPSPEQAVIYEEISPQMTLSPRIRYSPSSERQHELLSPVSYKHSQQVLDDISDDEVPYTPHKITSEKRYADSPRHNPEHELSYIYRETEPVARVRYLSPEQRIQYKRHQSPDEQRSCTYKRVRREHHEKFPEKIEAVHETKSSDVYHSSLDVQCIARKVAETPVRRVHIKNERYEPVSPVKYKTKPKIAVEPRVREPSREHHRERGHYYSRSGRAYVQHR